jgi:hypothetical protein
MAHIYPPDWPTGRTPAEIADYLDAMRSAPPNVADYQTAIVAMLDAAAQSRRYDNGLSLSTYTGSTNPTWAAEAQAYVAWRDAVWAYAYAELDKVMTGERAQPSVEGFLAELPVPAWPA